MRKSQLLTENTELKVKNAELNARISTLEQYVDSLEKDKDGLREAINVLQNGLLAKESPEAYHDKRTTELLQGRTSEQEEELKLQSRKQKIQREMIEGMESPLFTDADEMIATLAPVLGTPESNQKPVSYVDES